MNKQKTEKIYTLEVDFQGRHRTIHGTLENIHELHKIFANLEKPSDLVGLTVKIRHNVFDFHYSNMYKIIDIYDDILVEFSIQDELDVVLFNWIMRGYRETDNYVQIRESRYSKMDLDYYSK